MLRSSVDGRPAGGAGLGGRGGLGSVPASLFSPLGAPPGAGTFGSVSGPSASSAQALTRTVQGELSRALIFAIAYNVTAIVYLIGLALSLRCFWQYSV